MPKKKTAVIVKAPTKYIVVDEAGKIRGTSSSWVSIVDIARDLGFNDTEEVGIEECLQLIYMEGFSLRGLCSKSSTEQEN